MRGSGNSVSYAMEDYLEAILNLSDRGGEARVTDIAAELDIAKASVSQAISVLKSMGLANQEKYGPVTLTPLGRKSAESVRGRHQALLRFLTEVLHVDPVTAEKDACLIEHVVSPQTMKGLIEFLTASENPPKTGEKLGKKSTDSK